MTIEQYYFEVMQILAFLCALLAVLVPMAWIADIIQRRLEDDED